jgi:hypothetical protein
LLFCSQRIVVIVIRIIVTSRFQHRLTHSVKTCLHRFLKGFFVARATGCGAIFFLVAENVPATPGHLVQILTHIGNFGVIVTSLSRCKILFFFAPFGIQKLNPDVLADIFRPRVLRTLRKLNTNNLVPGVQH